MQIGSVDDDTRYVPGENSAPGDFCSIAHESRYHWVFSSFDLKNKTVLDFGCGSGYGSYILAGKASSVLGVDISPQSIAFARKNYSERTNLGFECYDLTRDDLPAVIDRKFDVIVSFDVIEHVEKFYTFAKNIRELLADGGVALIGCPNRFTLFVYNTSWNLYHMQEFTPVQLDWLLRLYFGEVSVLGQDFKTLALKDAFLGKVAQQEQGIIRHVKGIVKALLPETVVHEVRQNIRRSYPRYENSDMVFKPIDLNDVAACEQPYGLVAICRA